MAEVGHAGKEAGGGGGSTEPFDLLESIPHAIKERLFRLQRENKKLQEQCQACDEATLHLIMDDFKDRESKLEAKNRQLSQKILELEDAYRGVVQRLPGSREEAQLKLVESQKKVAYLQEVVHKKDLEMQAMQERYNKYIEKAKSVIRTLDAKQNPNAITEMSALRKQLTEKDAIIESLAQESGQDRAVIQKEDRLIASAYYNLYRRVHLAAADENRLSNLRSSSPTQQAAAAAGPRLPAGGVKRSAAYSSPDFLDF